MGAKTDLDVLQKRQVRMIRASEKGQVELDRDLARQDSDQILCMFRLVGSCFL